MWYCMLLLYKSIFSSFTHNQRPQNCSKDCGKVMRDAKATRSRTCLLLENKKQNTFAFENNLESTKVPRIYEGSLNPQGEKVWNPLENRKEKI